MSDQIPYSEDAERSVLGALLIDVPAIHEIADKLHPEDFYLSRNKVIYQAMISLIRAGIEFDIVTLDEYLTKKGGSQLDYLIDLTTAVPTSSNIQNYARIVMSESMRRKLGRAAASIANLALDTEQGIERIIGKSESVLFDVTQQAQTKQMESISDSMARVFDVVNERRQRGVEMVGLATGFADIDSILEGLEPGNLYVFAGRPGMGKSLFESAVSLNVARKGGHVARFNLEMPIDQVKQRLVAADTGLALNKIRRGKLTDSEFVQFSKSTGELSLLNIWTDDTPGITLNQLTSKCRRIHAQHGIDLITVDHIGLMRNETSYGNRSQDVGYNSQGLKRLAKDLRVPVLVLSQLNRGVEQRADKRPMMSDLRDSGEIEQDADVVMLIYRDEYYNPDTTERPSSVEVNIAKHRNGVTGNVDLYFDKSAPRLMNGAQINL